MGTNDTYEDVDATCDALIISGAWSRLRDVVAHVDARERHSLLYKRRPQALAAACEDAITSSDWATMRTLAALDASVVRSVVGKLLAAACLREPLDEAATVANVQAFVAHNVVQEMLRNNTFVASSAFMLAIDNGHVAVVQALVDSGAELSTWILDRFSLLRYAVARDNSAIVEYLLSVKAPMDFPVQEAKVYATDVLAPAIKNKNREMLARLVRAGAKHGWAEAAVAENDFDAIQFLIEQGMDPLCVNEDGESVLHIAIRTGNVELAKRLLNEGHDPYVVDKKGRTLMHVVQDLEAFQLLHAKGVSTTTVDKNGRTPLHACCMRHDFSGAPSLPMEIAVDTRHSTTHNLAEGKDQCRGTTMRGKRCKIRWDLDTHGFCEFHSPVANRVLRTAPTSPPSDPLQPRQCRATTKQGNRCRQEDVDVLGYCKFHRHHRPSKRPPPRVVDVDVLGALLDNGAENDVNKLDKFNCRPLHYLLQDTSIDRKVGSQADPVTRLLKAGADTDGCNDSNVGSPLQVLLGRLSTVVTQGFLNLLRLLCEHGAEWDAGCDELMKQSGEQVSTEYSRASVHQDNPAKEICDGNPTTHPYQAVRACIQQWMKEKAWNQELTDIPIEVFSTGEESIKNYILDLTSSRTTWRRKICVIGPSKWGKTSFVRSILAGEARLMNEEDRTIGIDIRKHSFVENANSRNVVHQVMFWDFAGQDVYRATHRIFFTERTLYVLCIDLELYVQQLEKADQEKSRFVHKHIVRWVETIASFDKSPEFFVVGTKSDKLKTGAGEAKAVWDDLREHIKECELLETAIFLPRGSVIAADRDSAVYFSGFIAVDNTNDQSVMDAREQLESFVKDARKSRSFQMTERLMTVHEFVEERRTNATVTSLVDTKNGPIAKVEQVCREIQEKIGSEDDPKVHLLPTLHNLGEIVWRQDSSSVGLKNHIIFDPLLVISVVKEVVDHNRLESTNGTLVQRLREEGFLLDKDLIQGKVWGCMNGDQKLAFKNWLLELDVAYPANRDCMQRDSDLIVPAFWTIKRARHRLQRATSSLVTPANTVMEWTFEVSATISEEVFKGFAVRSYRPRRARRISWSSEAATIVVNINDDTEVQIAMQSCNTDSWDVISIRVGSTTEAHAVPWLQYYVLKMESVLEGYKQHRVEQRIVQPDGDGIYVTTIQDELDDGYERQTWPRTSSDLTWYEERHNPAILKRIEETLRAQGARHERQMRALETQVARGELGKRVPGRWTVQLTDETLELRMLSDEPVGKCYHKAIAITVPSWRKYAAIVDAVVASGKDLLSQVVPSLVVEFGANKLLDETQKAILAHAIITKLGLLDGRAFKSRDSDLSEAEEENALLGLLCLAGKDVSEDGRVQRLCKLKRELQDGHFVWVYDPNYVKLKLEIDTMGEEGEKDISWELRVAETEVRAGETVDSGKDKSDTIFESLGQLRACNLHVVVKQQQGVSRSHEAILALSDVIPTNASTVDIVQNKTTELRSMRSTGKYIVKVHLKSA